MSYQVFSIKDAVNFIECGRMFLSERYKKFLWKEEANGEQKMWFKIKNILKFEDEFDVIKFTLNKYKNNKAGKNLCALFKILTSKENSPLCSYVLEERILIDSK